MPDHSRTPIEGTDGLKAVLDAPEQAVRDGCEDYGGQRRRKQPKVEVIDMATKPRVRTDRGWGYPEQDVAPSSEPPTVEDVTDAPIHGSPGMGRDYRPSKDDKTAWVGIPEPRRDDGGIA